MRTAPLPVIGSFAERSLDRVILYISHEPCAFIVIAYPMIKGLLLPERLALSEQTLVRLFARVGLPVMQNLAQRVVSQWPNDGMKVIGHDYPGTQFVALAFEKPDSPGDELGHFR